MRFIEVLEPNDAPSLLGEDGRRVRVLTDAEFDALDTAEEGVSYSDLGTGGGGQPMILTADVGQTDPMLEIQTSDAVTRFAWDPDTVTSLPAGVTKNMTSYGETATSRELFFQLQAYNVAEDRRGYACLDVWGENGTSSYSELFMTVTGGGVADLMITGTTTYLLLQPPSGGDVYFLMEETTAAPAAVANRAAIYAIDNGAGKTKLMVRFGTGAAQQIAIEP